MRSRIFALIVQDQTVSPVASTAIPSCFIEWSLAKSA